MPLTDHIALVSLTREVPTRLVLQAAAAVQKQITRDFTPFWGLPATVDAFEDLASVPSDYHPVVVFGDPDELTDELSPLVGEQLAADLIDDVRAAAAVRAASQRVHAPAVRARRGLRRVERHAESRGPRADRRSVRQPADRRTASARARAAREVPARGVRSLPGGLVPGQRRAGLRLLRARATSIRSRPGQGRYSFTGEIEGPLQILDGGYLSWIDPADSGLYQLGVGRAASPCS